ncbi:hypothetical protein TRFO_08749 [Tritrichomonas foetus]|uniref:Target of rapamycin complex subunit LST8 n=1 Tax=Tritrichomonas foetus TaxID=1144522 RepID=A0A1J4JJF5_9EUKA|nr:hypothetical protein TRFO_08749 [Tritrichomonas foetus]|eukprot:OHS98737.1 hypothetical protein TRFO_08749 [Tritrichomonas foetus]
MTYSVLLAASYDLKIHAFDLSQGTSLSEFEIANSQANRIYPYMGHKFYVATYNYVFQYDYYSRTKKPNISIVAHDGNVTDLKFNQTCLITCGNDKKIMIWDRSCQLQSKIEVGTTMNSLELLPSGSHCIVACENGTIQTFDIRKTENGCIQKLSISSKPVRSIALSSDSLTLVAATHDGKAISYSVANETLAENYRISTTKEVQTKCSISPDSHFFVTGAADNTAKIWDLKTGELKNSCFGGGNQEWVWDLKFTADSQKLVTGSSDGTCRIWDVASGNLLMEMPRLEKCISALTLIDVCNYNV